MKRQQPSLLKITAYSLIYILSLIWQVNKVIGFVWGIFAWLSLVEFLVLKEKIRLAKCSFFIPVLMFYLLYLGLGSSVNFYIALVFVALAVITAYLTNFRRKEEK